ncbi:D-alanine--D-alanine ligase [Salinibacterium sp. SYSU T00001]|uniref:D-alanine--D-alanine ligase family protein n=1 Tax=Homoserinimonas sedimenticola TaxID=2986805 RepID=UPI00223646FD|nr:D-alanine--D-alanine ligase [Salinibacterium sedimenticola]MCW4385800.1 D-alanine--D-alanine ligase [Salinibacterium sedimenticola]
MDEFTPRTVLILAGGISHERDVSLRSGRRIADSLRAQGISVELRDPDATLFAYLEASQPDVVWPALHGAGGEDGSLRGLLDFVNVPFVGSRAAASRLAWDKPTAKALVDRAGVTTPRAIALSRDTFRDLGAVNVLDRISAELSGPVVVKPAQGGSAQGVTIVDDPEDLASAMVHAYRYWDVALVEQKIVGTEISVCVIDTGDGPVALAPVEIEPISGFYSFEARYNAGETRFYTPARVSDEVAARASEMAIAAHSTLGLRHISRVDIMVDGAGTPFFLEASVMPGLTETSLFPRALEVAGHDVGWAYLALCQAAVRESRA